MKIRFVLFLFLFSFTSFILAGQEDTLTFAIGEWQPYTGTTLENFGLASEIVMSACKLGGLITQFEFLPWKRAEQGVVKGTFFGTFPYKMTKERAENYLFTQPIFNSVDGILLHNSNPRTLNFIYSSKVDLKGYTVGTLLGSDAVSKPLKQMAIAVEEVATTEQNLKKLEAHRIDFCIDDKAVIIHLLEEPHNTNKKNDFHFTAKEYSEPTAYYIMVSKNYPNVNELVESFNEGLTKLKKSGDYKRILAKYGL